MKIHIAHIISLLLICFLAISGHAQANDIKPFAKDAVEKGWTYFNNGDLETAFKRFHQATIIDPEFAPGYFGKAYVYSVQNKLDLAIKNYNKTIELAKPPFSHAYSNLGLAYQKRGEWEKGHKMLLEALKIDPKNGDAHINIALSFCYQNDTKEAWKHIEKAKKLKTRVTQELLDEINEVCPTKK